jgi:hypothetical protein
VFEGGSNFLVGFKHIHSIINIGKKNIYLIILYIYI